MASHDQVFQGKEVTQTLLGRLTIQLLVASFMQCIRAKNL